MPKPNFKWIKFFTMKTKIKNEFNVEALILCYFGSILPVNKSIEFYISAS